MRIEFIGTAPELRRIRFLIDNLDNPNIYVLLDDSKKLTKEELDKSEFEFYSKLREELRPVNYYENLEKMLKPKKYNTEIRHLSLIVKDFPALPKEEQLSFIELLNI